MKSKVFILTIIFTLIVGQSTAYGMGFWDKVAKHLISEHKIYNKKQEREEKAKQHQYEKEARIRDKMNKPVTQKQMERILKDVEDEMKPPLERTWLQKIDVYKEVIEKSNFNPEVIQSVIDHIEIFGHKKYGDKLSEKHKDFQSDLKKIKREIIKEKIEEMKNKDLEKLKRNPLKDVRDAATGITILGGIAYILRVVIFKSPM